MFSFHFISFISKLQQYDEQQYSQYKFQTNYVASHSSKSQGSSRNTIVSSRELPFLHLIIIKIFNRQKNIYIYKHTHIYIYVHIYICIYTHIYIYIHTYTYIHIKHTQKNIHIHIHIYTQK